MHKQIQMKQHKVNFILADILKFLVFPLINIQSENDRKRKTLFPEERLIFGSSKLSKFNVFGWGETTWSYIDKWQLLMNDGY